MRAKELAAYEERLLLGGRWLPVTQEIGFIRAAPDRCVDLVLDHYGANYLRRFGQLPERRIVKADGLEALLHSLLPMRPAEEDKHLFVPTHHPEWTAVFSNRWQGLTASLGVPMAERGVPAVHLFDAPTARRPRGWAASVGYRWLFVSMPCEPWTRRDTVLHGVTYSVGVQAEENRRWVFERMCSRGDRFDDGIPGPVGIVWDEGARRTQDRFTHDHLRLACERLGLFPFDADFYAPEGWGVIVERTDPGVADLRGYTLAQARGEEPH
jgi:hypothetical protein